MLKFCPEKNPSVFQDGKASGNLSFHESPLLTSNGESVKM